MTAARARIITGIFLIAFSLVLTQCRNNAATVDPKFVGVWTGTDSISPGSVSVFRLSIDDQSNGYWFEDTKGNYETAQGIARIKHDKLHIGLRSFAINEYPMQDSSGIWQLILDGVLYKR
jgi:hypothetical protein